MRVLCPFSPSSEPFLADRPDSGAVAIDCHVSTHANTSGEPTRQIPVSRQLAVLE
jgi:hypothetical protein